MCVKRRAEYIGDWKDLTTQVSLMAIAGLLTDTGHIGATRNNVFIERDPNTLWHIMCTCWLEGAKQWESNFNGPIPRTPGDHEARKASLHGYLGYPR
jgi:hypothetical protein